MIAPRNKPKVTARPARRNATTPLGQRIVAGLTEALEALKSGEPLEKRFTVRTVTRLSAPRPYDAAQVRTTRELVGTSQAIFAQLIGVSTVQVQSWEQGVRVPSRLACRLLDEINRDPAHWQGMVGASTDDVPTAARKRVG